MSIAGRLEGAIGLRFTQKRLFRTEEIELAQALANQATLAMHLTRLSAESREAAVIAERNRMARDIHDTLAQGFTGVIVQLEAAADATSKGLANEADEHLGRAADLARESLKEARRSVRALRPLALEDKGLGEALDNLLRKMTAGATLRATFSLQGDPWPLPAEWEENLLHIGQEVLTKRFGTLVRPNSTASWCLDRMRFAWYCATMDGALIQESSMTDSASSELKSVSKAWVDESAFRVRSIRVRQF